MIEPIPSQSLLPGLRWLWILMATTATFALGPKGFAQTEIPKEVVEQSRPFLFELKDAVTLEGRTYEFDQAVLEKNLAQAYSALKESKAESGTEKKADTNFWKTPKGEVAAYRLAYGVIAAGEFATATDGLINQLNLIVEEFGDALVPEGVTTPERQYFGAASMSFVDKSGETIDGTGLMEAPRTDFNTLVMAAKLKMAVRATSKRAR